MSTTPKLPRAVTMEQLETTAFELLPFEGRYRDSFGTPQLGGSIYIDGNSGNGKTALSMQLAKYLTQWASVLYDSIEEGVSQSMADAVKRASMREVSKRFRMLHKEPIQELIVRLRKRKSARVIFIDSIQHSQITKSQYLALMREFGDKKLFVWIGHIKGNSPDGAAARFIKYDANIKIRVEGYKAFPSGRLGAYGGSEFIIVKEKADEYWGKAAAKK